MASQGDQSITTFNKFLNCESGQAGEAGSRSGTEFNYNKHFNLRGFYDYSNFEITVEDSSTPTGAAGSINNWGIEEVDAVDKWQIVEEKPTPAAPTSTGLTKTLEDASQPSVLLDSQFRDRLSGELELLYFYFTERKNQSSVSNPLLLLDPVLAKLNNELSLEEIQDFIKGIEAVQTLLENVKFKQNLSFYESEKGKERMRATVDSFNANIKRKERQLWKLEDSIKELKASVEDADDQIRSLNKTINELRVAAEKHLSALVKRNVIVPKVTL